MVGAIQLPYCNSFSSIWHYRDTVLDDGIDFLRVIGEVCPICGRRGCYREITGYLRGVIELFPEYREGEVLIARFQCSTTGGTFSLLPTQLIPYHRYTVASVVAALLLAMEHNRRGARTAAYLHHPVASAAVVGVTRRGILERW